MLVTKQEKLINSLIPEAREIILPFLQSKLDELETGNISLLGEEIFAKILAYNTSKDNNQMVEAHRQYVDIQFLLEGEEKIHCYDQPELKIRTAYSEESDCEFYFPSEAAKFSTVYLKRGFFAIFFPEDAHLAALNPEASEIQIKKIVIKIHEKYFA